MKGGAMAIAAPPESDDVDHNTQLQYIKQLLQQCNNFFIVPLDDDDNDDSEDEAEAEEEADPLDTEESHLTPEADTPDRVIGYIFVKTLTGNTITVNYATTKANIIDIKNMIEKKDGLPLKIQMLNYIGKKLKHWHTVGFYNIEKENTL
ncbi:MAG: ubiquitin-like protein, partial [Candidatus Fonsibacter sp.]